MSTTTARPDTYEAWRETIRELYREGYTFTATARPAAQRGGRFEIRVIGRPREVRR